MSDLLDLLLGGAIALAAALCIRHFYDRGAF